MEPELTPEQAKKRQDYEHAGYRQIRFKGGLVYMVKSEMFEGKRYNSLPVVIHANGDSKYLPLQPLANPNL